MKLIKLTQGKFAKVDDIWFPVLNLFNWSAQLHNNGANWYACSTWPGTKSDVMLMHRLVTLALSSELVDHKDRDGLNNQFYNLRVCSNQQNSFNRGMNRTNFSSNYKGVSKWKNKWAAKIRVNYKLKHLGYFSNQEEAALMYNLAAIIYFGDFAYLNEIDWSNLGKLAA